MKNTVKTTLTAGLLVVAFGLALTFCTSKSDKPVAEGEGTQDTTFVVQPDSAAQEPVKDSTESK